MPFNSIFRAARARLWDSGRMYPIGPAGPLRRLYGEFPPVTHDHPLNDAVAAARIIDPNWPNPPRWTRDAADYPSDPEPRIPVPDQPAPPPTPKCAACGDTGLIRWSDNSRATRCTCLQPPQVPRPCNVITGQGKAWCRTCGAQWGGTAPTVCGYRWGAPGGERFPDKVPPRLMTRLVTEDDARLIDEARAIRDAGGTPAVVNWDLV